MQQKPLEQHADEAGAPTVPGDGAAAGSGVKRDLDLTPEGFKELLELAAKGGDPASEGHRELMR
eukprot:8231245-Pyramimonas_sp.AAC.1